MSTETQEVSKQEMISLMYEFALQSDDYRQKMKNNPKAMLGQQMGQELPDSLNVKTVEEDPNTFYLVVPHVPSSGDELSDDDLEQVAGGKGKGGGGQQDNQNRYSCTVRNGNGTRTSIEVTAG